MEQCKDEQTKEKILTMLKPMESDGMIVFAFEKHLYLYTTCKYGINKLILQKVGPLICMVFHTLLKHITIITSNVEICLLSNNWNTDWLLFVTKWMWVTAAFCRLTNGLLQQKVGWLILRTKMSLWTASKFSTLCNDWRHCELTWKYADEKQQNIGQ